MRAGRAFTIAALAFLFLAESQRAYFATLIPLAHGAVHPELAPGRLLLAALPLTALFAPLLPLTRWIDRGTAIALVAAGMAVFRLPVSASDFGARVLASTLVLAFGGLFLAWAVGWLDRRALAAGAVAGLVADHLLRVAGSSWDLSLRPGWIPVQAILSLALIALVLRRPVAESVEGGLERRAGGLRLRGALALGLLLFLDLHVLSLSPVAARWTGAPHDAAALATASAGGVAAAVALAWPAPVRGRWPAVGMVLLIGAALVAGRVAEGLPPALLLAAAHGAALLLVARTLHPASGRRSPAVVPTALVLFAGFTALYAATFAYPSAPAPLAVGAVWVLTAAVALLLGAFLLLPEPVFARPSTGRIAGGLLALAVPLVAGGLLLAAGPAAPDAVPITGAAPVDSGLARVRAGTYDLRYGIGRSRHLDADAIARTVRAADADVLALHGVPIGTPASYGVDLPLWLERRIGVPVRFVPGGNALQGQAVLARAPLRSAGAIRLPSSAGGAQLLGAEVLAGERPLTLYALEIPATTGPAAADAIGRALGRRGGGPAVLVAALDPLLMDAAVSAARAAGFRDAAGPAGAAPLPEASAVRVQRVWVRGLDVAAAEVIGDGPSDHRAVVATLQIARTHAPTDR